MFIEVASMRLTQSLVLAYIGGNLTLQHDSGLRLRFFELFCVTLRPVTVAQGTTFSAMLGDMLEAVRWPQDPTPAPGSPFSRAGSKGGKPESPTATRVRVPVGQIGTSTLAAHPTCQLFLTGYTSASRTSTSCIALYCL